MKLGRDNYSGAVINYDEDGYKQAKIRKQLQKKRNKLELENQSIRQCLIDLETRINKLENLIYNK